MNAEIKTKDKSQNRVFQVKRRENMKQYKGIKMDSKHTGLLN
jgi:hypothetical protein